MKTPFFVIFLALALLALLTLCPDTDIFVSRLFYTPTQGFGLRNNNILEFLTFSANFGARVLLGAFTLGLALTLWRKTPLFALDAKSWSFLILALLVGPGLVSNIIFKDHWGRARPRETTLFNGTARFTPAFVLSDQCDTNCSFVSGDGSFGFFLPAIAFIPSVRRKKKTFYTALAFGSLFGLGRILSGAHFLSDVLTAAFLMQMTNSLTHSLIFGRTATRAVWQKITGNTPAIAEKA